MDKCLVYKCKNQAQVKFPIGNRIHIRKQWLESVGEIGSIRKRGKGLCEKHFHLGQFSQDGEKRKRVTRKSERSHVAIKPVSGYFNGEVSSDDSSDSSSSDDDSFFWRLEVGNSTEQEEVQSIPASSDEEVLENNQRITSQELISEPSIEQNNQIIPYSPISPASECRGKSPGVENAIDPVELPSTSVSLEEKDLQNNQRIADLEMIPELQTEEGRQLTDFNLIPPVLQNEKECPEMKNLMEQGEDSSASPFLENVKRVPDLEDLDKSPTERNDQDIPSTPIFSVLENEEKSTEIENSIELEGLPIVPTSSNEKDSQNNQRITDLEMIPELPTEEDCQNTGSNLISPVLQNDTDFPEIQNSMEQKESSASTSLGKENLEDDNRVSKSNNIDESSIEMNNRNSSSSPVFSVLASDGKSPKIENSIEPEGLQSASASSDGEDLQNDPRITNFDLISELPNQEDRQMTHLGIVSLVLGNEKEFPKIKNPMKSDGECSTSAYSEGKILENDDQLSDFDNFDESPMKRNIQNTPYSPISSAYENEIRSNPASPEIEGSEKSFRNSEIYSINSPTKQNDQSTPFSPISSAFINGEESSSIQSVSVSLNGEYPEINFRSNLTFIDGSSARRNNQMTHYSPISPLLENENQYSVVGTSMEKSEVDEHVNAWVLQSSRIKIEDALESLESTDRAEHQYANFLERHDESTQTDPSFDFLVCNNNNNNNNNDEKATENFEGDDEIEIAEIKKLGTAEKINKPRSGRRWSSCSTDKDLGLMMSIRGRKVNKLAIRSEEFIENHLESLQILCRENELMNPSYRLPIAIGDSSHKMFSCHCDLPIKLFGALQYLGAVGVAPTSELSKQAAAKNMCDKLEKLLNFSKNEPKINPIERKFNWCLVKKKRLRKPKMSSPRPRRRVKRRSKIIRKPREWKLYKIDSPVRKIEFTEVRKMKADAIKQMLLDNIETVEMSEENFWDQDYLETRLKEKPISRQEDAGQSETEEFYEDVPAQTPKISEYHQMMINTCGIDLRQVIRGKLSRMMETMIECGNAAGEPFFIDQQLENLDDIMALIDIQVSNTVFSAQDGRLIRLIHISSIPEIVEIEESFHPIGLGNNAFCKALERLIKLVT